MRIQLDLRDGLVGERGTHHIRWMAGSATQIDQAPFSQQDDALAVWENHMVHLRFDVFPGVLLQGRHFDFVVEMADVANDRLVFHLAHVRMRNHMIVAGAGNKNIAVFGSVIHRNDAITLHRRLQCADRIDFSDPHLGRQCAHGLG